MSLFSSLPRQPKQWCLVVIITFISISCFFFESSLFNLFGYYHSKIANGEYWRLFTGQFFHANDNHLIMNLLGLWCLWLLHGDYYRYQNYAQLFVIGSLTTALGMFFVSPQIEIYVGLSGILHGIIVWGALQDIKHKHTMGYLLLLATIGKVGYEQTFGASEDVVKLIEMNVAVNAHLFGAIGGGISFYLERIWSKK